MGIKQLSRAQKQKLVQHYGDKQTQTKWNDYYSRVQFTSTAVTAHTTGFSFDMPAGQKVTAFGYTRNGPMDAAGLPGVTSTEADTNIVTAFQTISSETVLIVGVGLILQTTSDANFAKALWPNVSVKIKLNSTTDFLLGTPDMVPGPGGLFGASEAQSVGADLFSVTGRSIGALSNGLPHASNFMELPEPMIWSSAGHGDSNFAVELAALKATSTPPQYSIATRAAATGTAGAQQTAYIQPAPASVFASIMVVLVGCTVNMLSSY